MVGALALAACGSDSAEDTADTTEAAADTTAAAEESADTTAAAEESADTTAAAADAGSGDLAALADECTAEGQVNLIALPDEWANYKGILAAFGEKYPGVEYPVADPNAGSADEMKAVETLAGQDDMPDSVDVSPAIAQEMVSKGLFEPYTPSVDAEVPDGLKDPEGNWVAAYYGIMAIFTNTSIVTDGAPATFADLEDPKYKGQVNLNGDPRESGAAFAGVMAAAFANGGSADDIMPGIQFFADLKVSGNLGSTADATPATVLAGETPILLDWSYNLPGMVSQLEEAGIDYEQHFPADGIYGGYYAQGVIKNSPHQACSKLWLEHILSDEGALGYLAGGAVPARIVALTEAGLVTEDAKKNLPPDELLDQVSFMTSDQIAAAKDVLAANWGPMVADA
jgi:putative spermidine/putrescine transport system substrate-binding protein